MMNSPLDDYFNTELSHEQLFYEDGQSPSNEGFFPKGVFPDDEPNLKKYKRFGPHYDDELMREVVDDLRDNPGDYCIIGNNCQDWADRVRQEYERRKRRHEPDENLCP